VSESVEFNAPPDDTKYVISETKPHQNHAMKTETDFRMKFETGFDKLNTA